MMHRRADTPMMIFLALLICLTLAPWPAAAQPDKPAAEPGLHGSFLGLRQAVELALHKHPVVQEGSANLKAAAART
ncbi:MAG: hypothetical protein ACREIB_02320, partial [Pseudomonadota bacterium]